MGATAIAEGRGSHTSLLSAGRMASGVLDAWTAPRPWEGPAAGGECTLEDVILGAWEGLAAHRQIACPVCDGAMVPGRGSDGRYPGGTCLDCGARLS